MSFLGLVVVVLVTVFLVVDAPKYGKRPMLWGVLGFFFGLLSLGIYLVQTKRTALGVISIVVWGLAAIITGAFMATV